MKAIARTTTRTSRITKTRKEYYLKASRKTNQTFYIRPSVVTKYRGALTYYRKLVLFKQIFEVMKICRDNGGYITKGEFVAMLREELSVDNPTAAELNRFNSEIFHFRKWLGAIAGLVVYVKHEYIPAIKGLEWIYRPLKNKTEYKQVRKHFQRTLDGLNIRNEENLHVLSMTQKQIDRRIGEIAEELELEAAGAMNS